MLLHVGIGRIEPGSITLHERTGKLVVRTNRWVHAELLARGATVLQCGAAGNPRVSMYQS